MERTHQLILKNDNENDYMYVMSCLMRTCDHSREQAEQCAIIAHNVGKCQVKIGNFLDIMEMHETLDSLSLDVEIEVYEGDLYQR